MARMTMESIDEKIKKAEDRVYTDQLEHAGI